MNESRFQDAERNMFRLFLNRVFYAVVGWICYICRRFRLWDGWWGGWGLRIGCEWRGELRRKGLFGRGVGWWCGGVVEGGGGNIRRPLLKYAILYIPE